MTLISYKHFSLSWDVSLNEKVGISFDSHEIASAISKFLQLPGKAKDDRSLFSMSSRSF